jgi:hypothetical protein
MTNFLTAAERRAAAAQEFARLAIVVFAKQSLPLINSQARDN